MANETVDLDYYEKIKSKGIPLILFDRGENDLNVDYIGIDDYDSSHLIVEHLVTKAARELPILVVIKELEFLIIELEVI